VTFTCVVQEPANSNGCGTLSTIIGHPHLIHLQGTYSTEMKWPGHKAGHLCHVVSKLITCVTILPVLHTS
jgi:hypothetical protein